MIPAIAARVLTKQRSSTPSPPPKANTPVGDAMVTLFEWIGLVVLYFAIPACIFVGLLWGFIALVKFLWFHS